MVTCTISVTGSGREFVAKLSGEVQNRKGLNDALGRSLARALQTHFREKNTEPNRMGAPKTNFWQQVATATALTEATEDGATVTIAESRFRIHLFGGVIKPTGGRKFLTIPLIPEARALRASSYEQQTGRKLFRLPGVRLLFERSDKGTQSTVSRNTATVRRSDGTYRKVSLRGRSTIRPVYALAAQATIRKDDEALPPATYVAGVLEETATKWLKRNQPA